MNKHDGINLKSKVLWHVIYSVVMLNWKLNAYFRGYKKNTGRKGLLTVKEVGKYASIKIMLCKKET